ncbi:MAG TPA: methylated-DNA--[protein]-cysteine S-methyltransferase [Porticoccus sp.]|nr:methylated-DNA--[protein]-cysteine S-methyltransferase [Porticoccus sp.]
MKQTTEQRYYHTVEKALAFIQHNRHEQPSLANIAEHCAVSEFHFQRIFNQWAGVSPKQFLQSLTKEQARTRLLNGDSLLQASNDSGLSSSSRLHDLFVTLEAVTPGQIKSGGAGVDFYCGVHSTPFGDCFIANTERGIHRLDFIMPDSSIEFHLNKLHHEWPQANINHRPDLTQAIIQTSFSKSEKSSPLKLWVKGSQFQFKVWEALIRIPEGALCSYRSIAEAIDKPLAARAVGSAIASNTVALLIPCHRVIQASGTLGNYRWGAQRKQALVGMEACKQNR